MHPSVLLIEKDLVGLQYLQGGADHHPCHRRSYIASQAAETRDLGMEKTLELWNTLHQSREVCLPSR
jgi:hypothetical protein